MLAHVLLRKRSMHRESSIADALERTYEAGQSLIVRRVDLLVAEAKLLLDDGRTFLIGSAVAVTGWLYPRGIPSLPQTGFARARCSA